MEYYSNTDSSAVLYGLVGAGSALILSTIGAAYGSAKPNNYNTNEIENSNKIINENEYEMQIMKSKNNSLLSHKGCFISFIPIIIAGVLAIYGLIYAVIVSQAVISNNYSINRAYAQFVGGITLGFCCLASGISIGIVAKKGLEAIYQNKISAVKMIINLIYCEALGLYALIFALICASIF